MDRCNATRDLSPCTNCNGAECSERLKQYKANREWLNGLSNEDLVGNPNGGYDPQSGGNPNTVNDLGSALAEVYNTNG